MSRSLPRTGAGVAEVGGRSGEACACVGAAGLNPIGWEFTLVFFLLFSFMSAESEGLGFVC